MNPHTMKTINAFLVFATASLCSAANPAFTIDAGHPVGKVSPTLYGLMTEEINHAYDGGLYAELIQNRIFKDDPKGPAKWSLVTDGGGAGDIALDKTQPINGALTVCLKLDITQSGKRVGIAN